MPTLKDLQNRFSVESEANEINSPDESLITDSRASMTPSQVVERKLRSLLSRDAVTAITSELVRKKAK